MGQFIPANLNLSNLLVKYPPNEIKNFSKDKLIYVIDLITTIPSNNKDLEIINGYVPVYSKQVKGVVGNNYRQYFDYLIRVGVFESNNQYIVGKRSKGYRFAKQYRNTLRPAQISSPIIRRYLRSIQRVPSSLKKDYGYLIKWFDHRLAIDRASAMDFISNDYKLKSRFPELRDIGETGEFKDPYCQYVASVKNIERIVSGEFHFSVDSNVHRFHSNITNLKSSLRNYLSYEGIPLCSIDLKNSQPYISTILLTERFWEGVNTNKLISVKDIINKPLIKQLTAGNPLPHIMCIKSSVMQCGSDFEAYIEQVTEGTFYEYLKCIMERKLGLGFVDRKTVKKMMLKILFSDNRFIGQIEATPKRIFKEEFPSVYGLFALIKGKDKTVLPRLLQCIESYLMIKIVARRIGEERPSVPMFTIHDSIVTTVGNEDYIRGVMEEELEAAIGYPPITCLEYWLPEVLSLKERELVREEIKAA